MSDQSPPPKPKPGSLRDRIAAFENKGASTTTAGPPPPRPKPGGLQWKPRAPSPPISPENVQSSERKPASTGGMSASDAMESIGRGGSLKERMAALQGKGAFGGPPPPIAPKPNVERPKWKPPPAVSAPASSEADPKDGIDAGAREASRSPPPRAVGSPTPDDHGTSNRDSDAVAQEDDDPDPDPEEEEKQRRAAIAARMARLGGAKFGMAPPIFAPKPAVRKSEPALPAPDVKTETHGDQPTVARESSEALVVSPPHDSPVAVTPVPEAVAETERKDDLESPPPVPTRALASMPIPVGPRRAAPPRKKASKNAPTTALPEPPVEEVEGASVQAPPASADSAISDVSLTTRDEGIGEVAEAVGVPHGDHLDITTDAEQRPSAPTALTGAFHEESEKQEAKEELVEGASSHVDEESMHTVADEGRVPSEQRPEAIEAGEDEDEARRQRVAAKLAQMGAFNPLAGPPIAPRQPSFDEPAPAPSEAPLDVEDEVNVDTEEYGETVPSPLTVPSRHDTVQSRKHDPTEWHVEADQDDRVAAHRDGERTVASYTEEQGGEHNEHTLPHPESSEDQPIAYDSVRPTQGTASTGLGAFDVSGTALLGADVQDRSYGDTTTSEPLGRSTTAEHDMPKIEEADELPPPRAARPIPPPPVNLQSKPTPPSPPPSSAAQKTPQLQALRVDEEVCPPSPDIPPRPIPPPGRSGSMTEDVPSPPRRSLPPPPRRTSVRVTDSPASPASSPPPVPTSPRPVSINRRPDTPPIITTVATQEQAAPDERGRARVAEETAENVTPRPESPEDEECTRRRAIADRMARLGGIRFGGPPLMNPLSRPPLPSAPPPTSIPPDELEEEAKEQEGPQEEDEEDDAARKQRIAAKLAGMGGMRLGMLPPPGSLPPASIRRLASRQEDSEGEDAVPPVPIPAPSQRAPPTRKPPQPVEAPVEWGRSEKARKESLGMSDDGVQVEAEESEMEEVRYSDAEAPVASEEEDAPALPPPRQSAQKGVEVLPTPPPRTTLGSPGRPPISMIPMLLGRRPSTMTGSLSVSSSRHASLDESSPGETPTTTGTALRSHSEFVMVEAEDPGEDEVPAMASPPRRKPTRGGSVRTIPALPPVPPPSAIDPPEALSGSAQWELTSIPQGPEFGEGSEMASSRWSEDSTAVHVLGAAPGSRSTSGKVVSSASTSMSASMSASGSGTGSGRRSVDQQQQPQLTTDELMAIWGKTGVRVVEAATTLFEKSKRALVGDGSHAGFVRAVLAQVPGAATAAVAPSAGGSADEDGWGYVVYAQTGNAVQRRVSDIMPGDVIAFRDAKFKGHKGLHVYTQTVGVTGTSAITSATTTGTGAGAGVGEHGGSGGAAPLVGIVSDFDAKKSKVRVWQANQHVGQQTVENVSYRLDDLKSGQVKVYRVLDSEA